VVYRILIGIIILGPYLPRRAPIGVKTSKNHNIGCGGGLPDDFSLAATKPLIVSPSPANTNPYNRRAKQKDGYVVLRQYLFKNYYLPTMLQFYLIEFKCCTFYIGTQWRSQGGWVLPPLGLKK